MKKLPPTKVADAQLSGNSLLPPIEENH